MSRELPFTKMHGAGNDFVVLDGLRDELPPLEPLAARLLDRHFGIGGDQLLVVRESRAADFRMEIFNPDGSQVEMCANGIRAFYKYVRDRGHTDADEIGVETLSGIVYPRWAGENDVSVDMGRPVLEPAKIPTTLAGGEGPVLDVPLEVGGETVVVSSVSMGNPHAVMVVDDVDSVDVARLGAIISRHPAFPEGCNAGFAEIVERDNIRLRVYERGAAETRACGSGACAAMGVLRRADLVSETVKVTQTGGDLILTWMGGGKPVKMMGPATHVFEGTFT